MFSLTKKITYAKIYGEFEALHKYTNAPEEVSYLRNEHRHLFKVIIQIEQFHNNRDIEYYMFKTWLNIMLYYMDKPITWSCEMYCDHLSKLIEDKYGARKLRIEVNEDNMEGAICEYEKNTNPSSN